MFLDRAKDSTIGVELRKLDLKEAREIDNSQKRVIIEALDFDWVFEYDNTEELL